MNAQSAPAKSGHDRALEREATKAQALAEFYATTPVGRPGRPAHRRTVRLLDKRADRDARRKTDAAALEGYRAARRAMPTRKKRIRKPKRSPHGALKHLNSHARAMHALRAAIEARGQ